MKRFAIDLIAVGLIVGLLTVGLLSGPASASANGPSGIHACSTQSQLEGTRILCVGTINGNDIRIDISTNPAFEATLLTPTLDQILASAASISDILTQVNTIATRIVQYLMWYDIHSCRVTVTELWWTGFATCS